MIRLILIILIIKRLIKMDIDNSINRMIGNKLTKTEQYKLEDLKRKKNFIISSMNDYDTEYNPNIAIELDRIDNEINKIYNN
jgi:hypothetical protein